MNKIIDHVSFFMEQGCNIDEAQMFNEQNNLCPMSKEQFNTVLHPTSKWELHMEFDGRANITCNINTYFQTIKRVELFEPHATLRDVLERIVSDQCYGYIEGIDGTDGVFYLRWGT